MKLADYMKREGLDDAAIAGKVATDDLPCERTMISRFRRGIRRPEWRMINRIAEVTNNEVTGDDWMKLIEAAE